MAVQLSISRTFLVIFTAVVLAYLCRHLLFRHVPGGVSPAPDSSKSRSACSARPGPGGFVPSRGLAPHTFPGEGAPPRQHLPVPPTPPPTRARGAHSPAVGGGGALVALLPSCPGGGGRHRAHWFHGDRGQERGPQRFEVPTPQRQMAACPPTRSQAPACSQHRPQPIEQATGHLPVLGGSPQGCVCVCVCVWEAGEGWGPGHLWGIWLCLSAYDCNRDGLRGSKRLRLISTPLYLCSMRLSQQTAFSTIKTPVSSK